MSTPNLIGQVYDEGAVIYRQGDAGDTLYLVQSGSVAYSYKQGDTETVLTTLGRGDFFGEMALFGQERRPATVTARQRTRLLPLTRDTLLERMHQDPGVTFHLLQGLYSRIQHGHRQVQQAVEGDELLQRALAATQRAALATDPVAGGQEDERAFVDASLGELAGLWGVEQKAVGFEPGQQIYAQGDAAEAMYIILNGSVELQSTAGTQSYAFFRLSAGDFFGESELILERTRVQSAVAVEPTRVMPIARQQFVARIKEQPELAFFILQSLSVALQTLSRILANPGDPVQRVRRNWRPVLVKQQRIRLSIVSLSTCAGCSAVFLDQAGLDQVLEMAEIVYCPMLIDQQHMPETDVALVDGVVRLKEDEERLQEVRRKSQVLIAWGTCACYGGIPAQANVHELEDLIRETYGQTSDAFAYYLSGAEGVDLETYQQEGVALLRKAYNLEDFCRVNYYVPGCPPNPDLLFQLHWEVTGQSFKGAKPIVCAECSRRPTKEPVTSLEARPRQDDGTTCFHSLGVLCTGLLTKGGCGAVCTRSGLPCWGCRGPAKTAQRGMASGNSFEETVISRLVQRCRLEEEQVKPAVKRLRRQGHTMFGFEHNSQSSLVRSR